MRLLPRLEDVLGSDVQKSKAADETSSPSRFSAGNICLSLAALTVSLYTCSMWHLKMSRAVSAPRHVKLAVPEQVAKPLDRPCVPLPWYLDADADLLGQGLASIDAILDGLAIELADDFFEREVSAVRSRDRKREESLEPEREKRAKVRGNLREEVQGDDDEGARDICALLVTNTL